MPDAPDPLPPLREVIAAHGLTAKKSLGQNFLFDLNLTRRIARAAGANEGGLFYEVGPGPGGLTRALLAEGTTKVVAVERDRTLHSGTGRNRARLSRPIGDRSGRRADAR
ncbi:MAG: rRNA adenine N-6-methyltransferase family protein [Rhizomicrobium sp.]